MANNKVLLETTIQALTILKANNILNMLLTQQEIWVSPALMKRWGGEGGCILVGKHNNLDNITLNQPV